MVLSRGCLCFLALCFFLPENAAGFGLLPPMSHRMAHQPHCRSPSCSALQRGRRPSGARVAVLCAAGTGMEGLPGDIGPPVERSLEAWLENLGADISALRVADFSDGVRGLEATRDLAEGEFALTVPLDACIIDDGHANFPEGWGILQWQGRTAYRLAVEKAKGSASRWHPYIAMLPSKPPRVPARWSEEELEELQDPWLAAEAESLTMWSDELYDEASRLPPPPGCEGCSVPTKDEFLWALDTLQSRTIRIDREDGGWEGTPLETPSGGGGVTEDGGWVGEGDGTIRALVPWLDMLNHSPDSENFFSLKQGAGAVQVQMGEAVAKGSQVHLNYGRRANDHFVQFYGFAVPDNEDEVLKLRAAPVISAEEWESSPKVSEAASDKEALLLAHLAEIPKKGGAWVRWGELSVDLVGAFRLLVADDDDYRGELKGSWGASLGGGVVSAANERRASERLAARLRMEMRMYRPLTGSGSVADVYVGTRLRLLGNAASRLEKWAEEGGGWEGGGGLEECLLQHE